MVTSLPWNRLPSGRSQAHLNDTWGEMRTRWAFKIAGGKISRFETGQA